MAKPTTYANFRKESINDHHRNSSNSGSITDHAEGTQLIPFSGTAQHEHHFNNSNIGSRKWNSENDFSSNASENNNKFWPTNQHQQQSPGQFMSMPMMRLQQSHFSQTMHHRPQSQEVHRPQMQEMRRPQTQEMYRLQAQEMHRQPSQQQVFQSPRQLYSNPLENNSQPSQFIQNQGMPNNYNHGERSRANFTKPPFASQRERFPRFHEQNTRHPRPGFFDNSSHHTQSVVNDSMDQHFRPDFKFNRPPHSSHIQSNSNLNITPYPAPYNIVSSLESTNSNNDDTVNVINSETITEVTTITKRKKINLGTLMISDMQKEMRNLIVTMATLKRQFTNLEECFKSGNREQWQTEFSKTENLKKTLLQIQTKLSDSDNLNKLSKRIERRRKKRERIKKLKLKRFEEKQKDLLEREITEAKIDKWRETVTQKLFDSKQKVEMKKMADKTLSEVRSKISDTTRKLDLLTSLKRLRKIRMEGAVRIGRYIPNESDGIFEAEISKSYNILTNQREIYEGEEKTLKVLLETEQEESKDLANQRKQQIKEQREKMRKKKINEMLFGKEVELDDCDPMLLFYQYYNEANVNFESLVDIRHSWDCCIVPDNVIGGTRIPDKWVLPPIPSNVTWAKYLK